MDFYDDFSNKMHNELDSVRFDKTKRGFDKRYNFYKQYQNGNATRDNFYEDTMAEFEETEKPNRKPDLISNSGSKYWYEKDGVIRESNHWGSNVASCFWAFKSKDGKNDSYGPSDLNKETKVGKARWNDFIRYPSFEQIEFDSDTRYIMKTFNNKPKAKNNEYIINGKVYQKA